MWQDEFSEFYVKVPNNGRKYLTGKAQGCVAFPDALNNWYFINQNGFKVYFDEVSKGSINLQKKN